VFKIPRKIKFEKNWNDPGERVKAVNLLSADVQYKGEDGPVLLAFGELISSEYRLYTPLKRVRA